MGLGLWKASINLKRAYRSQAAIMAELSIVCWHAGGNYHN